MQDTTPITHTDIVSVQKFRPSDFHVLCATNDEAPVVPDS